VTSADDEISPNLVTLWVIACGYRDLDRAIDGVSSHVDSLPDWEPVAAEVELEAKKASTRERISAVVAAWWTA